MRPSNSRLDYWVIGPLRRFALNSLVVWTMLGLYILIDPFKQKRGPGCFQAPRLG